MSENKKPFWSGIPGLVTGLAGLLTGVVGLITLLVQLNVIGGDRSSDSSKENTATTTAGGQASGSGGGGTGAPPTTDVGRFTVDLTLVKFQSSDRDKTVTVTNASATTITMVAPDITGPDGGAFKPDAGCTNVQLRPSGTCKVKVLFSPSGVLKTYNANLVLKADGLRPTTLPIEASSIL